MTQPSYRRRLINPDPACASQDDCRASRRGLCRACRKATGFYRALNLGRPSPFKGKKHSPETIAKMRATHAARRGSGTPFIHANAD